MSNHITLADLCWEDKLCVICACLIGLWFIVKPGIERRRREQGIASATNVTQLRREWR